MLGLPPVSPFWQITLDQEQQSVFGHNKTLKAPKSPTPGKWNLESHEAEIKESVQM